VKKKKFGFVGAGNMGEALIKGLLGARLVTPRDILISDPSRERMLHMKKAHRVSAAKNNQELVRRSDVVFLSVKPAQINRVLRDISPVLDRTRLLVSIAAGVSLFQIESKLRAPVRLVRAMPNTPALVGEGATALSFGNLVTAADRKLMLNVFGAVGKAVVLGEDLMDAVTGLSGSGPAYVFTLIQGLADGGVQAGLARSTAVELAAQTVLGAARMVLETGGHPMQLRDQVASPAGTTIEGIAVLEEGGFKGLLMDAVVTAAERSRQLSEQ
jgi:pyrroline-5-carboxylate reductase